jgi:P2-related tail formation protein
MTIRWFFSKSEQVKGDRHFLAATFSDQPLSSAQAALRQVVQPVTAIMAK